MAVITALRALARRTVPDAMEAVVPCYDLGWEFSLRDARLEGLQLVPRKAKQPCIDARIVWRQPRWFANAASARSRTPSRSREGSIRR